MKNAFNLNRNNASKPFGYFLIGAVILALIISIFSCGKDNPVNNGNPPQSNTDSLVYTLDSVSVYGIGEQTYFFGNGITPIVVNDSVKLTFNISSNCGITDTATASIFLGGYFNYAFVIQPNQFNMSLVFNHLVFSNFSNINYSLYFNSVNHKYIKLSNIKIYKCYIAP